jgi:hypothetical protein
VEILDIIGSDATLLLRYLETSFSNALRRVWSTDKLTIGVFLYDSSSGSAVRGPLRGRATIVAEVDDDTLNCTLWVSSLNTMTMGGEARDNSGVLANWIEAFAGNHGWTVTRRKPTIAGTQCPHCGAVYVYSVSSGTVRCQNCNVEFEIR